MTATCLGEIAKGSASPARRAAVSRGRTGCVSRGPNVTPSHTAHADRFQPPQAAQRPLPACAVSNAAQVSQLPGAADARQRLVSALWASARGSPGRHLRWGEERGATRGVGPRRCGGGILLGDPLCFMRTLLSFLLTHSDTYLNIATILVSLSDISFSYFLLCLCIFRTIVPSDQCLRLQ